MAVNIKLKRSAVPGNVPTTSQLELGEIALNTYDGKAFFKQQVGVNEYIVEIASTGSTVASASYALYAASAGTASFSYTATSASYSLNATSASYASASTSASYALTATSASYSTNTTSASYAETSSYATNFNVSGNLVVGGSVTATTLHVQTVTSSIVYSSGSNVFGDATNDTQTLIGTVNISGSLNVTGSVTLNNLTGSLYGTASWAIDAINTLTASVAPNYTLTSSFLSASASFDTRATNNSASISYLSSSYLGASASFDTRVTNNSSSVSYLSSSYLASSASFDTRATNNSSSISYLSSSYLVSSASFDYRINLISGSFVTTASFNVFTSSYYNDSASFNTKAFNNSSSISTLSGSFLAVSASYSTRLVNLELFSSSLDATFATDADLNALSSSYKAFTSSMNAFSASILNYTSSTNASIAALNAQTASLLAQTASINAFTSSINSFTQSYYTTSGSVSTRLVALELFSSSLDDTFATDAQLNYSASILSASIAVLSGSYLNSSASFDTRITNNSASIANLSSSFLNFSGSFRTGSFTGSFNGVFSGSLNNLQGTARHIPFFSSSQILDDSSIYQIGTESVAINQNAVTTAAPEALYVWQPSTSSFNVISGKGNLDNYLQLNIQNTNQGVSASSDIVATANNGNETTNYIDMGINSQNFSGFLGGPNDAYVYAAGNEFHIGNITPNKHLGFFVGGGDVDTGNKFALYPNNRHQMTGSLDVSGSVKAFSFTGSLSGSVTGSLFGTASWANNATTASYALNATSASYAATASYANNFTVAGTLTAQTIIAQVITSSTDFVTGSTRFGSSLANTHQFTGSVSVTGSLAVNNSNVILTNQTSSMSVLSASYASGSTTASYALNATTASYALNATSASYSLVATSASYASGSTTASYALNTTSASYALIATTASYASASTSASYASASTSASFAANANTASYALNATTASYSLVATSASFASTAASGTGSFTGSFNGVITGSLLGTASRADNATSASYALVATSASYASGSTSASYALNATTASYSLNTTSASFASSGLGTFSGSFSGSFFGNGAGLTNISASSVVGLNLSQIASGSVTASVDPAYGFKVNSNTTISGSTQITGSLGVTGSVNITGSGTVLSANVDTIVFTGSFASSGSVVVAGNITSTGTITAQTLNVQVITSSVSFITGSSKFGTISSNTHQFTGSVVVSGSLVMNSTSPITGSSITASFTGSLLGTASRADNATSASYALNATSASYSLVATSASFASTAASGTGSFTGSFRGTVTGSLLGTASRADNATSSSFAAIASFATSAESADFATSASYAQQATTASYALNTTSASYASASTSASFAQQATTASYALNTTSASYAQQATSASYSLVATSASFASTAASGTGSFTGSFNGTVTGSLLGTASRADNATSASYSANATSASYADNASTSSFAITASYATFAALANQAASPFVSATTNNVDYGVTFALSAVPGYTTLYRAAGLTFNPTSSLTKATNLQATGSLLGTSSFANNATSASFASNANTASYALNTTSASFASNAAQAQTASFVTLAQTASFVTLAQTASFVQNAQTASFVATASYANNADLLDGLNSTVFATTGSNIFNGNQTITGSINISGSISSTGTITAQTLIVQTITSSTDFVTGSTRFGSLLSNTHQFTGSVSISGSLIMNGSPITGSSITASFTGSLLGTASRADNATSASWAAFASQSAASAQASTVSISGINTNAEYAFPLILTGSSGPSIGLNNDTSPGFAYNPSTNLFRIFNLQSTGSLLGTSSFADNATSSSYSLTSATASYANNADLLDGLNSTVFATTGSNTFRGNQTVTGSLFTSGSNTLIGNTVLSGSVGISGSTTIDGTTTFRNSSTTITGSLLISGSTTQIGNNTLNGNTSLSGSIVISGSLGTSTPTVKIYGDIQQAGYHRFDPVTTNIDTSISASYIYVSGSTNDLYFSQNGAGYTNTTRLRWLEGNLYTGLLNGGLITATTGSTTFNLSSGSGIIVNLNASIANNPYPTVKYVNWGNFTNVPLTYLTSSIQSFIGIDDTGNIFQQNTAFNDGQYNTIITIGSVLHQNKSTINASITYPNVAYGYKQRSYDFLKAFGPLKLSGLTINTSSSLGLTVGSGTAFADGRNYQVDPNNPSYITDPGTSVSKIFRYWQSGSEFVQDTNGGLGYTTIDPTQYNTGTALASVSPSTPWTNQRVFWYPNSATKGIVVYYGKGQYASSTEALANLTTETFSEVENTKQNAVYLGSITIKYNGDFTTPSDYIISPAGIFRSIGGSGGGGSVVTTRLVDLSDVAASGATSGQALVYDSTSTKWENKSFISASISGNAATATSATTAATASFVVLAQTASFVQNAQTASYVLNAISSSFAATASSADNFTVRGTLTAQTIIAQTVTSSTVFSSGSNRFGNDLANTQTFTGSLLVTGSNHIIFGNVGIGTATPLARIHEVSNGLTNLILEETGAGNAAQMFFKNTARTWDVGSDSSPDGFYIHLQNGSQDYFFINPSGSIGIGKNTPNARLDISGSTVITGSLTVITGSAVEFQVTNTGVKIGNAITDIHTVTGSLSVSGSVTATSFTGSLLGTASRADNATSSSFATTAVSASFASTASFVLNAVSASFASTASFVNTLNQPVTISGSLTVFTGSAVEFQVTNTGVNIGNALTDTHSVTGSLNISGSLSISSSLFTYQQNTAVATGSFQTIVSVATGSYRCAFFDYVAFSGSVVRAGTVVSTWSGSATEYYENYTADLGGNTSIVTLQTAISSSNIQLQAGISGSAWSVRSLVRLL